MGEGKGRGARGDFLTGVGLFGGHLLSTFFSESLAVVNAARRPREMPQPVELYLAASLAGFGSASSRDGGVAPGAGGSEASLDKMDLAALSVGGQSFEAMRAMGDRALIISGFFAESLARSPRGRPYYRFLGEGAYGRAAMLVRARGNGALTAGGELPAVFHYLSQSFEDTALILEDLSDLAGLVGGSIKQLAGSSSVRDAGKAAARAGLGLFEKARQDRLVNHYRALVEKYPRWRTAGELDFDQADVGLFV